jgi:hormone-sensitive lipase
LQQRLFDYAYIFHFQTRDKDGTIRHNHNAKPKADGLVIHIHGGGFVAQSSKSHEVGIL